MKTRMLNQLRVSEIGYGVMGLSHRYGEIPDEDQSLKLLQAALDSGYTFFDTAEGYGSGKNEVLLGKALKAHRSNVQIATKFNIRTNGKKMSKEEVEEDIRKHLKKSMERLQTNYIDLYYEHRRNKDFPVEWVAEVMGKLISEKQIGGWGLSQVEAIDIKTGHEITPLTAIQSEYSIMERMFEDEVIPLCQELGIGFVAFAPLASGFLSGKVRQNTNYYGDDIRRGITRFKDENISLNQPLLDYLNQIAVEKSATTAQVSLAWMLKKYNFVVPIPGTRSAERIVENQKATDIELSDDEFQKIETELKKFKIYGNRTDEDIMNISKD
ncbi:aldo/keto reductase [Enterococcus sp. LJL120]